MIKVTDYDPVTCEATICYLGREYMIILPDYWFRKLEYWLYKHNFSRAARFLRGVKHVNRR